MKAALSLLVVCIAMVAGYTAAPKKPIPYKRPAYVPHGQPSGRPAPGPLPRPTRGPAQGPAPGAAPGPAPHPARPYYPPQKPHAYKRPVYVPHRQPSGRPAPGPSPNPVSHFYIPHKPTYPTHKPNYPTQKSHYPTWSSWTHLPSSKPWWYGRTSLGRPVIGVTRDGRPITDSRDLRGGSRSIFSGTRIREGTHRFHRPSESLSSGDSISFETYGRRGIFGASDQSSFSRSSESWESRSDEDRPTQRRVRLFRDEHGRHVVELVPSSESNSSGDSISHEDTWFGPYGSYSASSGSESSSQDNDRRY